MAQSVTEIIWEIYPFKWNFFQRALSYDTLKDKALEPGSIAASAMHLDAAQTLRVLNSYGSFAHRMAKRIINWHDVIIDDPLLEWIRVSLMEFFATYDVTPILNEWTFTLPGEYGWTLDMVCELEWKSVRRICVLDFKTYWLYRDLYGIPHEDKASTALKKLKNVGLQTSMYAHALKTLRPDIIQDRWCMLLLAWMTPEKIHTYELVDDISPYLQWKNLQSPN